MAGLGLLVAGVAHEINSPTAAIRGSIDGLANALSRVARHNVPPAVTELIESLAPQLAERPLATGLTARKMARELAQDLEGSVIGGDVQTVAAELADLGVTREEAQRFVAVLGAGPGLAPRAIAALTDHVYLHRT